MPYEPTIWQNGDVITAEKLNKLENGVANASVGDYKSVLITSAENLTLTEDQTLVNGYIGIIDEAPGVIQNQDFCVINITGDTNISCQQTVYEMDDSLCFEWNSPDNEIGVNVEIQPDNRTYITVIYMEQPPLTAPTINISIYKVVPVNS